LISKNRWLIVSSALAGIYASLLIFIKFDLGVEVILTVASYILLSFLFKYEYPTKALAIFGGAFVGCFSFLCALLFKGLHNWVTWILSSLEIVRAYAEGWNENCPVSWCLYLSIFFLLIYLIVVLKAVRRREKLGYLGLALLPSLLLICKHGFILGNPWHIVSFYKYALVVIALLTIHCLRKVDIALLMLPFICLFVLVSLLDNQHQFESREVGNPHRLESMKLPESFLPDIDRRGKTFDGIPTNMMWCFANGLQYKPNPSLILNLACSQKLDKRMAKYFFSNSSSDYLFCEFLTLCGRHMFFENPQAWRNILDLYQIYKVDSQRQVVLLIKKKEAQLSSLKAAGQFMCNAEQWYAVPENNNMLYCSFDFQSNIWGRLCQLFYKTPGVFLNVKYADGQIQSFKLMPIVSNNAVLINYLPEDLSALIDLFAGKATNHVTAFQLLGPGLGHYQFPVPAVWMQSKNKIIERQLNTTSVPSTKAGKDDFFIANMVMSSSGRDQARFVGSYNRVPIYNDRDGVVSLCLSVFEKDKKTPVKAIFIQIDQNAPVKTASRILAIGREPSFSCRESVASDFKMGIDLGSLRAGIHTVHLIIQSQNDATFGYEPEVARFAKE